MTPTQWQQIHDLAVANITQSFLHMRAQAANERFYGFCLGLVEDLCGFFCARQAAEANAVDFNEAHGRQRAGNRQHDNGNRSGQTNNKSAIFGHGK